MAMRAAAASEPHVASAAREALATGNAADAVVAGLLAAAAESPGVLLGPLQVLLAGGGAGLIAIDGRLRQPGLDAPRPRGVRPGDDVPPPARVAVPAFPATLVTLLASFGTMTLRKLGAPAAKMARVRSPERAAVLDALSRRGAPVMTEDAVATDLLAAAGRAAGGLLTRDDLGAVRPVVVTVTERTLEPVGWLRAPWRDDALDGARVQVVSAADARGLLCIACYEVAEEGVSVPRLGLLAPAFAEPVRRGSPRVRPGEPRPASAPIAVRTRKGVADLALGLSASAAGARDLEQVFARLDEVPVVSEALAGTPGRAIALVRTAQSAVAAASA